MTKGLALARLFYLAGHDVIGADFEPGGSLVAGRVSKSIRRFYRLNPPTSERGSEPYISSLLRVVNREKVDLWVSCSGVASAVEDGLAMEVIEAGTGCRAIQYGPDVTKMLHEKNLFVERTRELGLVVPETVEVTGRKMVEEVFRRAPVGRRYILKTVGVDDSVRGDMTLLPKSSEMETRKHLERLRIGPQTPWIVQQFIDGLEYCTHALVVRGQVMAFVACPSAELLMHYEALDPESALSKAMLKFTKTFTEKSGPDFTGHLSFDFLVEYDDLAKDDPDSITLYPIECNPRAHTAVALFNGTLEMADAYLSILAPPPKPSYADAVDPSRKIIVPRNLNDKYYWTGHDLTTKFMLPLLNLILRKTTLGDFVGELDVLFDHLFFWKDGTYEMWDPWPWWWLYHVYWPLRFWEKLWKGVKWSRLNVSTGKMFEC